MFLSSWPWSMVIVFSQVKLTKGRWEGKGFICNAFFKEFYVCKSVVQTEKKSHGPDEKATESIKGNRKSEEKIEKLTGFFFSQYFL